MNDLGVKMGLPARIERMAMQVIGRRAKVVERVDVKPLGNLIITEVADSTLPTAVIFRDSFLTHAIPVLAEHFRRLVIVWQPNFDWSILERERPDYVISQQAERFLVSCPDDVNGKTNAQYASEKIAREAKLVAK